MRRQSGSADLDTTISGNIEILESDDISLTSVVSNNGNINITATAGNITVVFCNGYGSLPIQLPLPLPQDL